MDTNTHPLERIADSLATIAGLLDRIADGLDRLGVKQNGRPSDNPAKPAPTVAPGTGATPDPILRHLQRKNIAIVRHSNDEILDSRLDGIIRNLGDRHALYKDLLNDMRRAVNKKHQLTLHLAGKSPKDISRLCNICSNLYESSVLTKWYYKRKSKTIYLEINDGPQAVNFINGKWLERYVLLVVREQIQLARHVMRRDIRFGHYLNPHIRLPNGQPRELDLLFHIDGTIYWLEAKSGQHQGHASKYGLLAKKALDIPPERMILVLGDTTRQGSEAMSALHSIRVIGINDLRRTIQDCLVQTPDGGSAAAG